MEESLKERLEKAITIALGAYNLEEEIMIVVRSHKPTILIDPPVCSNCGKSGHYRPRCPVV